MKEIVLYLKWTWQRWEFWEKMFIFAVSVQLISWALPNPYGLISNIVGFGIVLFYFVKWFIWERSVENWKKYKKEKSELFDVIKGDK